MADNWHKRHALQLAAMLPDNASDATAIIRELQHLVDTWLHVAEPPYRPRFWLSFAIRPEKIPRPCAECAQAGIRSTLRVPSG
jgi:hypothetical protein